MTNLTLFFSSINVCIKLSFRNIMSLHMIEIKGFTMNHLHIFLLAGVQTKDSAFNTLTKRLNELCAKKDIQTSIQMLYPYGDYTRKLWKQVLDICIDFNFVTKRAGLGGQRINQQLEKSTINQDSKFLLIGHSGGGVAAYRWARFLHYHYQLDLDQLRVVQIGSPKIRVSPHFQKQLAYIQAVDEQGMPKDPITKIGYWGGLHLNNVDKKGWNSQKYAPSNVHSIPLIGGHADYFRVNPPFVDVNQQSNLDYTFNAIENWLNEWI